MSYFVAVEDFIDETDGAAIKKGVTHVSAEADCYRLHPAKFKQIERSAYVPGITAITRVGGVAELAGEAVSQPRPRRVKQPIARAQPKEYTYRDVELFEHYVDYRVELSASVKRDIEDEIRRVHREAGEVEIAGWLFARYQPRADSNSIELVYATRSTAGRGTRREVYLSDPAEAEVSVHRAGLGHLKLAGDWHLHCERGSELPSLQDARAWAGTMDSLGRSAYVSVIVSPSESQGWLFPKFSAWVAGRDVTRGLPSRPVVGRAHMT
jgi:hypothetical protein